MIPLSAEKIFSVFNFNITNTVTATLLTDAVILAVVFFIYKSISVCPGRLQNIAEMVTEYFYTLSEQIAGTRALKIFPWFLSFFIFIVFANLISLLPGYGLFEIAGENHENIPLFRAPSSDINTTLALAVISVTATHYLSIKFLGFKNYIKKFLSLSPLFLFVGILDIVSEITKLISFSFRLFGNIFAGEIVLSKISSILSIAAPIPFFILEFIVAIVQALVFSMLTMAFMSILTNEGGGH